MQRQNIQKIIHNQNMHQLFLALFERFCTKNILPPFKNINHKYTTNQPVLAFPQKQTVVRACMWQDKHMCSANVSCSEKENTHYRRPCSVCLLTSNKGIEKNSSKEKQPWPGFCTDGDPEKTSFSNGTLDARGNWTQKWNRTTAASHQTRWQNVTIVDRCWLANVKRAGYIRPSHTHTAETRSHGGAWSGTTQYVSSTRSDVVADSSNKPGDTPHRSPIFKKSTNTIRCQPLQMTLARVRMTKLIKHTGRTW